MKREYRLRNNRDFTTTYRKGKSLANPLLVLVYRKNNKSISRVGFSVSKKFGKAVKRNKIKRQLKDITHKKFALIKSGYDIIFIVRQDAKNANFQKLDNSIKNLLLRAKLYR